MTCPDRGGTRYSEGVRDPARQSRGGAVRRHRRGGGPAGQPACALPGSNLLAFCKGGHIHCGDGRSQGLEPQGRSGCDEPCEPRAGFPGNLCNVHFRHRLFLAAPGPADCGRRGQLARPPPAPSALSTGPRARVGADLVSKPSLRDKTFYRRNLKIAHLASLRYPSGPPTGGNSLGQNHFQSVACGTPHTRVRAKPPLMWP